MMETCWCQHHWHRYTEWKSSFFFKWKIPLEKDDRMTYSHLSSLVFDNKHTHKLVVALVGPSSLASPLLTTTTTRRRLVKYKTFTNQPREMVAGPIVSTDNRHTRQLLGNGRDAVDYFWQQHNPLQYMRVFQLFYGDGPNGPMRALYTNFLLLQVKGQRVGTLQSTSQVCESLFFKSKRGEKKNQIKSS